ncbi:FeoA family protein [Rubinisphaera margarita]|uniref:FeoA family protein n=1 Tax=Rubinisphaera margarita TaxID=2909586 RepID=UPI001EE8600D|nr:ferrous iron transport protein A [Rubinisphaera margarita]MCG6154797.1 ferrous iron transport protein A [Rubinisphaera margarita]
MPKLNDLKEQDIAIVEDVEGSDSVAMRLMEMGIIPGEEIELIGRAPLGDPLEFRISGYQLSLRKSEAARVTIRFASPE